MRRERVTEREVLSAVRASGVSGVEGAAAVYLESDGSMSVIQDDGTAQESGGKPL